MYEIDTSRGLCITIETATDAAECLGWHLTAHRTAGPTTFLVRRSLDGRWASCTIDSAHGPDDRFQAFISVQLHRVLELDPVLRTRVVW